MKISQKLGFWLTVWFLGTAISLSAQSAKSTTGTPAFDPMAGNLVGKSAGESDAKEKWIKDHPEEYRKQGGNPEEVLAPKKEVVAEKPAALPSFSAQRSYQLVALEAIPRNGHQSSAGELSAETAKARTDFPINQTRLEKGSNGQVRLVGKENMELRAVESVDGNHAEWLFTREGCPSCTKTITLAVREEGGKLIYIMDSEDADSPFAYRFTFSPISK